MKACILLEKNIKLSTPHCPDNNYYPFGISKVLVINSIVGSKYMTGISKNISF